MISRGSLVPALTLALAVLGTAAASAAACSANLGNRVVLESDALDPDVFLWDSRDRLVDYTAGQWGNTRAIFAHTILAEPGTEAMVVSCFAGVAHPKFSSGLEDAVGVKILKGPHKGRYGWILSSDAHASRPPGQSSANVAQPRS